MAFNEAAIHKALAKKFPDVQEKIRTVSTESGDPVIEIYLLDSRNKSWLMYIYYSPDDDNYDIYIEYFVSAISNENQFYPIATNADLELTLIVIDTYKLPEKP